MKKSTLGALALALAVSSSAVSAANPSWECKDMRDDYVFRFNQSDTQTTGHHPTYGKIVEVTTIKGTKILITEYQMQHVYRCEKVSDTPWKKV